MRFSLNLGELMKTIISIFVVLLLLFSCKRKEFKTYTGNYECQVAKHTWAPGEPTEYVITEGHLINVSRDKKYLEVLERDIHIDSIAPGELYYSGTPDNYFSLRFVNDSIYVEKSTSSDGAGTAYMYFGPKLEDD